MIAKYYALVMLLITISVPSSLSNSRRISTVKFNWECEHKKCIKKVTSHDTGENIQSFSVCKLLCGDSIIWPKPVTQLIEGPPIKIGKIMIDPEFILENDQNDSPIKELINGAINIFMDRIKKEETNRNNYFENIKTILKIKIIVKDKNVFDLSLSTQEEAYELNIKQSETDDNLVDAIIKGDTFFGIRHGLETLSQLIVQDNYNGCLVIPKKVSITDYPKYPYRGLMLDTARNYFSVGSIKRTIDIMSVNKLNSFHWHLSDTHSFPMRIEKYNKFAEYGAYSPEKIYTEDDIESIVKYAKIRGIRVIPELDAPGHTGEGWQSTSNGTNLCFDKEPWTFYCKEPPCGQLNPLRSEVYSTLGGIYNELVRLFQTRIFHMGGDEVSLSCWESSNDVQEWFKRFNYDVSDNAPVGLYKTSDFVVEKNENKPPSKSELFMKLTNEFQSQALNKLKDAYDKVKFNVILWTSHLTGKENLNNLNNNQYIIQVWESIHQVKYLLDNNFRIILSNYNKLYLDCGFGNWVSEGNNWCSPYKSWHIIYGNTINSIYDIPEDKQKLILGQEVPLWTETVGEGSLDSRLWPRSAALAERTWTDPSTHWREAEGRMLYHRERLVKMGCNAEAIEPEWCNINRNGCS